MPVAAGGRFDDVGGAEEGDFAGAGGDGGMAAECDAEGEEGFDEEVFVAGCVRLVEWERDLEDAKTTLKANSSWAKAVLKRHCSKSLRTATGDQSKSRFDTDSSVSLVSRMERDRRPQTTNMSEFAGSREMARFIMTMVSDAATSRTTFPILQDYSMSDTTTLAYSVELIKCSHEVANFKQSHVVHGCQSQSLSIIVISKRRFSCLV